MDYEGRSLKAQMRSANRVKAPWVVIIGGDELAKGVVKLRDMGKSEEVEVKPGELAGRVRG